MRKPILPQPMGPNGPIVMPMPTRPTKMRYAKPVPANPARQTPVGPGISPGSVPTKQMKLPGQKSVPFNF